MARPGRPSVPSLAEVREPIRAVLKEERLNAELARWTQELREEAERYGSGRVEFTGFLGGDDFGKTVAGARFVVVPSRWYETQGLVVDGGYFKGLL